MAPAANLLRSGEKWESEYRFILILEIFGIASYIIGRQSEVSLLPRMQNIKKSFYPRFIGV
jgi:hypothetical protein